MFADFYTNSNEIRLFQNHFAIDINQVTAHMQMEVIELQSNGSLKDFFRRKYTAVLCSTSDFKFTHHQDFRKKKKNYSIW
jgi:hypothetical protein